jgi:hypothetical protein
MKILTATPRIRARPCYCGEFHSLAKSKEAEEKRQREPWNPIPPVKREPSPKPKEPEKVPVKPKEGIGKWF